MKVKWFKKGKFMNIDFKKALVTGGAGFIGSHMVEALMVAK